jgi:hypothetical protein
MERVLGMDISRQERLRPPDGIRLLTNRFEPSLVRLSMAYLLFRVYCNGERVGIVETLNIT